MKGKTALITGSSGGIGFAMAEGLARAGCSIALHGLEPAGEMAGKRAQIESLGVRASYHQADLAQPAQIELLMGAVRETHGAIDILVNNAVTRHFAPIESFPVEAWDRAMAVNISAAFHTIRLGLPGMRERGWGRIFNLTSVYGSRGVANRVDYVTSKTALLGITRAVAMETVGQGITCNAICPGAVLTPTSNERIQKLMEAENLDEETATQQFLTGKQPGTGFIPASHIAELIVFLCGPAGSDMTGSMLPMERGWLAS